MHLQFAFNTATKSTKRINSSDSHFKILSVSCHLPTFKKRCEKILILQPSTWRGDSKVMLPLSLSHTYLLPPPPPLLQKKKEKKKEKKQRGLGLVLFKSM